MKEAPRLFKGKVTGKEDVIDALPVNNSNGMGPFMSYVPIEFTKYSVEANGGKFMFDGNPKTAKVGEEITISEAVEGWIFKETVYRTEIGNVSYTLNKV